MSKEKIGSGASWISLSLMFVVLASPTAIQSVDRFLPLAQDVESVIAGEGVEIGHIDSKSATFSIHSINDMFVLLVSRDRSTGVVASPVVGPVLCRMLDSPAMFAELHEALAVGMDQATVRFGHTMSIGNGEITVLSSDSDVTIILRSKRHTTSFSTTANELRRLSDELAGFILRHGGGGTVRTP
ncbi:MAG: hypothetical protein DRJ03_00480 [Chloroflexi bacterium]|nr:MAG: hypothetical protein DRJ03_00480 [Chloroflexota bacterium]